MRYASDPDDDGSIPVPPDRRPVKPVKEPPPPRPSPEPDTPKKIV
jgi:hypothetical protein